MYFVTLLAAVFFTAAIANGAERHADVAAAYLALAGLMSGISWIHRRGKQQSRALGTKQQRTSTLVFALSLLLCLYLGYALLALAQEPPQLHGDRPCLVKVEDGYLLGGWWWIAMRSCLLEPRWPMTL